MAGRAHDVLVQALREDATLLPAILSRLRQGHLPPLKGPIDSAVRFTRPAEVRPDVAHRTAHGWVVGEVQNKIDPIKRRRWLLAAAILHDETKQMGDVVVITASAAVARWARKVAHVRGPAGTRLQLTPVVVHLSLRRAKALLDPKAPHLALFAAWAMQHRHGLAAARVVEAALDLTDHLPPPLREPQWHAIIDVLNNEMLSRLREAAMHPDRVTERPAVRKTRLLLESIGEKRGLEQGLAKGRDEGRNEGRAEAARGDLLLVLTERGLTPAASERARIEACADVAQLGLWLRRAVTAASVAEVLAATVTAPTPAPKPRRTRPSPAARPSR